jgi:chromosome segregation ATPase
VKQSCTHTKTLARYNIFEARDCISEARDSSTTPAHDVKSQARPSEIMLLEALSHGAQMPQASQTASDSHDLVRALRRRVEELEAELSKTKSTLRETAQECVFEAEVAEERSCRLQSEEKVLVLEERVRELEAVVEERVQRCEAADAQVEALKEKICWLLDNDLCL